MTIESTSINPQQKLMRTEVRVSALSKTFQRRREQIHVLKHVDLDVAKGELLVLLGPSGCGKTTLLRCLVGLERPTSGAIELGGDVVADTDEGVLIPPNRRNVGMVFQNYALWPHMKVADNVAYPLKARKLKDALKAGRVEEVLGIVQCDHLADRYPPELSGGQQQRVSLARALAPQPAVLLFDEPLSNLDALLRIEMRAQLRRLHRSLGFTAVYVTHDHEEAFSLGTRVAVMNNGRIEQIGAPQDVYRNPSTEDVADFLGARNALSMVSGVEGITVAERHVHDMVAPAQHGRYTLRVRPADTLLRRTDDVAGVEKASWIPGRVIEILPGADRTEYIVEVGPAMVFVEMAANGRRFDIGDEVEVGLPHESMHCYAQDGGAVQLNPGRVEQ